MNAFFSAREMKLGKGFVKRTLYKEIDTKYVFDFTFLMINFFNYFLFVFQQFLYSVSSCILFVHLNQLPTCIFLVLLSCVPLEETCYVICSVCPSVSTRSLLNSPQSQNCKLSLSRPRYAETRRIIRFAI